MTLREMFGRLRAMIQREDRGSQIADELQTHIDLLARDYQREGMNADDAMRAARIKLGNVTKLREESRDAWGFPSVETLLQDVRYALRSIRGNPGFSAVVIATLALGIGANTAMFSVVNAVLLRPLPYRNPDGVARVYSAFHGTGGNPRYAVSQPEFLDYKGLTGVFENAGAYTTATLTLTEKGDPQRVNAASITRDVFPVLGFVPAQGANFKDQDGRVGTEPIAIVSDAFWKNRFGGDPGLLGSQLQLNGVSRRVVGILPPGAIFAGAEVYTPMFINPDSLLGRGSNFLNVVARLKPGVTPEMAHLQANALTDRLIAQYPTAYPASMKFGATVISIRESIVGNVQRSLWILLGAVAFVLVIACANVANLLLARGEARQREIAVRLALGAGRRRILAQLLTESMVLSLIGGAAGVLVALWGTKSLLAVSPGALPRADGIGIDFTVGLVTLGIALATGIAFGLAPALQLVKGDVQGSLKEGTRGGSEGASQRRLGRTLVSAEVALAVVVVVASALLVRSFASLQRVNPGFEPSNVMAVNLTVPLARYDTTNTNQFYRQLINRVAALPGVKIAAATSDVPPVAQINNTDMQVDGRVVPADQQEPSPHVRMVTHEYFKTLDIPVASGRFFGPEDGYGTDPVAVINETTAKLVFPEGNAIGQRIRFSSRRPWATIVGIARDVKSMGLDQSPPMEIFLLHDQLPATRGGTLRTMFVVARTTGDPALLAGPMRSAIKELDPLLAITQSNTVMEMVDRSVATQRFAMRLLTMFGALALVLAAIGVYGIMAYAVKRRTRELGIRMALGAKSGDVLRLIVGDGMKLSLVGLGVGFVVALAATRLMTEMLFTVSPADPVSFGGVAVILLVVTLVASLIPAGRAIRGNAVVALRGE
jgi:predicted permease